MLRQYVSTCFIVDIPKMIQKSAFGRVQSPRVETTDKGGSINLIQPPLSVAQPRELSIPPKGRLLNHFGYKENFLLLFHPKLKKWLPPGGHVEENETPDEAALREVREETGLEVEFLSQENLWTSEWNSRSIPRPFCCLLESIPPFGDQPAHEHIDFVFAARPIGGVLTEGRWFTLEEIEAMKTHEEIFFDTQEITRKVSIFLQNSPNWAASS